MSDIVLVLTTVGAANDQGQRLAQQLVDERLASCVNLFPPMVSIYRWKGQIERDNEQQVVIKTTRERLGALEARIKELHPYELPEFVVVSVDGGSQAYLDWVRAGTSAH